MTYEPVHLDPDWDRPESYPEHRSVMGRTPSDAEVEDARLEALAMSGKLDEPEDE